MFVPDSSVCNRSCPESEGEQEANEREQESENGSNTDTLEVCSIAPVHFRGGIIYLQHQ